MRHQPQEQTIIDLLEITFPKHRNKKAARTAIEFFLQESENPQGVGPTTLRNPVDMNTLQRFVDYMIERGYN